MKVTVSPIDAPQDGIVLDGFVPRRSLPNGPMRLGGPRLGWVLQASRPLDGWITSAPPRFDVADIPQGDGAYWPSQLLFSPRILTIRGGFISRATTRVAAAHDRLNGLVGRALDICVHDTAGPRWVRGFVSTPAAVVVALLQDCFDFTLVITCPDPLKYGAPVDVPAVGGLVAFDNAGNAPTWPTFILGGPVSAFAASLGGQVISWQGSAPSGLVIDTYEGTATTPTGAATGVLVDDDVFQLPPGRSTLTVATTPSVPVTLRARAAWR